MSNDFTEPTHADLGPRDVVRGPGMGRDTLLRLNAAVGTTVVLTMPGEVVEDIDGVPAWVAPPTAASATLAVVPVTTSMLAEAGVTPCDVPNLHIIERD